MYKSPVEIFISDIKHQMDEKLEEACYTAVIEYFPNVDKDELIRALRYDRQQYEQGYADGKRDAVIHAHWVSAPEAGDYCYRCSNCGRIIDEDYGDDYEYCAKCGAHMDEEVAHE